MTKMDNSCIISSLNQCICNNRCHLISNSLRLLKCHRCSSLSFHRPKRKFHCRFLRMDWLTSATRLMSKPTFRRKLSSLRSKLLMKRSKIINFQSRLINKRLLRSLLTIRQTLCRQKAPSTWPSKRQHPQWKRTQTKTTGKEGSCPSNNSLDSSFRFRKTHNILSHSNNLISSQINNLSLSKFSTNKLLPRLYVKIVLNNNLSLKCKHHHLHLLLLLQHHNLLFNSQFLKFNRHLLNLLLFKLLPLNNSNNSSNNSRLLHPSHNLKLLCNLRQLFNRWLLSFNNSLNSSSNNSNNNNSRSLSLHQLYKLRQLLFKFKQLQLHQYNLHLSQLHRLMCLPRLWLTIISIVLLSYLKKTVMKASKLSSPKQSLTCKKQRLPS